MKKISTFYHFTIQTIMTLLLFGGVLLYVGVIDFDLKSLWVAKQAITTEVKVNPIKIDTKVNKPKQDKEPNINKESTKGSPVVSKNEN